MRTSRTGPRNCGGSISWEIRRNGTFVGSERPRAGPRLLVAAGAPAEAAAFAAVFLFDGRQVFLDRQAQDLLPRRVALDRNDAQPLVFARREPQGAAPDAVRHGCGFGDIGFERVFL